MVARGAHTLCVDVERLRVAYNANNGSPTGRGDCVSLVGSGIETRDGARATMPGNVDRVVRSASASGECVGQSRTNAGPVGEVKRSEVGERGEEHNAADAFGVAEGTRANKDEDEKLV